MFRGMVFSGARIGRYPNMSAVLTSSILWTLWHFAPYFVAILLMATSGILLGVIRWKTGSLYSTIIIQVFIALLGYVFL